MGQPLAPEVSKLTMPAATLLARKWESVLLVNVDNDTLRRIMDNPYASGDGRG
jgi:hypothetical protein